LGSNSDGQISAQIVESSQIDPLSGTQKEIISNATHFNPVDLICYTHSYTGEKFNLLDYIDHNTGFITHKSRGGKAKSQCDCFYRSVGLPSGMCR
jgi:hypothetical protein